MFESYRGSFYKHPRTRRFSANTGKRHSFLGMREIETSKKVLLLAYRIGADGLSAVGAPAKHSMIRINIDRPQYGYAIPKVER